MASLSTTNEIPIASRVANLQNHPVFNSISGYAQFKTEVESFILRVTGGRQKKGSRANKAHTVARRDAIHKASGYVLIQMIQGSWSEITNIYNAAKKNKGKASAKRTKGAIKDMNKLSETKTGKALSAQGDMDAGYLKLFRDIFTGDDDAFDGFRQNYMTEVSDSSQCNKIIQYRISSNNLNLDTTVSGPFPPPTEKELENARKSGDKARILYLRRKNCYICQQPMWMCKNANPDNATLPSAECEHILPLFFALKHLWVVDKNWDQLGNEEQQYISAEYEYSHKCCNRAKTNTPWIKWSGGVCEVNSINVQKTFDVMKRFGSKGSMDCVNIIEMMKGAGSSLGGIPINKKGKAFHKAGGMVKTRVSIIVDQINADVREFSGGSSNGNKKGIKGTLEYEDEYAKYAAWSKLKALSILSTTDLYDLLTRRKLMESDKLWQAVEKYESEYEAKQGGDMRGGANGAEKILENFGFDPKTIIFWCFLTFGYPNLQIEPPTIIYSKAGTTIQLTLYGKDLVFENENIYEPSEGLQTLKESIWTQYMSDVNEESGIIEQSLPNETRVSQNDFGGAAAIKTGGKKLRREKKRKVKTKKLKKRKNHKTKKRR